MQNKAAFLSPDAQSHILRGLSGVAGGAATGAIVDSGNPERGALTGAGFGALPHAPAIIAKTLGNHPSAFDNHLGQLVMNNPMLFGGLSAGVGAGVGAAGTSIVDYNRLRNERDLRKNASERTINYLYGRANAVTRLGL